jgi:hypothetical protein
MKNSRRAMAVEFLGEALPAIVWESDAAPATLGSGAGALTVRDFQVHRTRELLDVTTFGDTHRQYVSGLERPARFEILGQLAPEADMSALLDAPLEFDETVGGQRIRATLRVLEIGSAADFAPPGTVRVIAEASGPVDLSPAVAPPAPEPPLPPGRRAMDLGATHE